MLGELLTPPLTNFSENIQDFQDLMLNSKHKSFKHSNSGLISGFMFRH